MSMAPHSNQPRAMRLKAATWALGGLALAAMLAGSVGIWRAFAPLPDRISVAAPRLARVFPAVAPFGPGLEQELLQRFARQNGIAVEFIRARSPKDAFERLAAGEAQIFLGTGFPEPPEAAGLPVSKGPVYDEREPLLLRRVSRKAPRPCDDTVSSLAETHTQAALEQAPPSSMSGTAIRNRRKDVSAMIVEGGAFELWQPFFTGFLPDETPRAKLPYHWFWRTDVPSLDRAMQVFWRDIQADGTLDFLREKYHGFFPALADPFEIYTLREAMRSQFPLYADRILAAAARHKIDPLLFTALIYQESGFDPDIQSPDGAVGLLQFTASTAEAMGISDRTDPAQVIDAGARYLASAYRQFERPDADPWETWCLALAAYNMGPGHVLDAQDLARSRGLDPRRWISVKEVLPLLEKPDVAKTLPRGSGRGSEAVRYVNRVRYFAYVLSGLSFLPGVKLDQLAPLASAAGS